MAGKKGSSKKKEGKRKDGGGHSLPVWFSSEEYGRLGEWSERHMRSRTSEIRWLTVLMLNRLDAGEER